MASVLILVMSRPAPRGLFRNVFFFGPAGGSDRPDGLRCRYRMGASFSRAQAGRAPPHPQLSRVYLSLGLHGTGTRVAKHKNKNVSSVSRDRAGLRGSRPERGEAKEAKEAAYLVLVVGGSYRSIQMLVARAAQMTEQKEK